MLIKLVFLWYWRDFFIKEIIISQLQTAILFLHWISVCSGTGMVCSGCIWISDHFYFTSKECTCTAVEFAVWDLSPLLFISLIFCSIKQKIQLLFTIVLSLFYAYDRFRIGTMTWYMFKYKGLELQISEPFYWDHLNACQSNGRVGLGALGVDSGVSQSMHMHSHWILGPGKRFFL